MLCFLTIELRLGHLRVISYAPIFIACFSCTRVLVFSFSFFGHFFSKPTNIFYVSLTQSYADQKIWDKLVSKINNSFLWSSALLVSTAGCTQDFWDFALSLIFFSYGYFLSFSASNFFLRTNLEFNESRVGQEICSQFVLSQGVSCLPFPTWDSLFTPFSRDFLLFSH